MAVLCTLPAQKVLPVCKPHFIKSRFSLLVVFQILCFTKLRFLQLQKRFLQKFKSFWTLEASPPVPHGGRALLRESPELPALHFALFRCPNIFSSFGSWRVRSSATVHFEVHFKRYSLPISLWFSKNRYLHLLRKASLRIPTPCPCFIYHFEHNISGTSGICIFSSKLITYCAVVRLV